jgi:hypothetical protein
MGRGKKSRRENLGRNDIRVSHMPVATRLVRHDRLITDNALVHCWRESMKPREKSKMKQASRALSLTVKLRLMQKSANSIPSKFGRTLLSQDKEAVASEDGGRLRGRPSPEKAAEPGKERGSLNQQGRRKD